MTNRSDPASGGFEITPGTEFKHTTAAIYVGGTGNVVVRQLNDDNQLADIEYTAVPGGTILPIRTNLVVSATATDLVAMYN